MEVNVTFTYQNKSIKVQCNPDEELNKMYEKFTNKLNDGSKADHYIYNYENNKLGHIGTIGKNKYLAGKKDINIGVQKKLRIIKCQRCKCNDCIVNLNDYLISFYGCKYGHSYTTIYDEYINIQKIDMQELRCSNSGCPNTQQNYTLGFDKCLTCSKLVQRSKYYCRTHLPDHENHIHVKFDKKNYFCEDHFKPFIKYCFTHKKNLCEDCVREHDGDQIKSYDIMVPNIDKLNESVQLMEKNVENLKIVIDDIKSRLDGTLRVFKRYLYIANDIIGKYGLFNKEFKNYRILKSLRNLKFSNIKMNKDLKNIIEEKDEIKKINLIIKIYEDKENNYRNSSQVQYDYNKENDEAWLEEIEKNEKSRILWVGQKQENKKNYRTSNKK